MTFSQETHLIRVAAVVVDRASRQRRDLDVTDLKQDIARWGLLHPIIVQREGLGLVTGERRLQAHRELEMEFILARYAEDLSPVELQAIELIENIRRQPLEWQDEARSYARIHALLREVEPDWTAAETADYIGVSQAVMSKNIRLALEMAEGNQRVLDAGKKEEAYNSLVRRDKRAESAALEDLINAVPQGETPTQARTDLEDLMADPSVTVEARVAPSAPPLVAPGDLIHGSFLEWAPVYRGEKFNLLHCDFPYGVGLFGAEYGQRGTDIEYEDTKEIYFELLEALCVNLDNFTSVTAHMVFWLSHENYEATMRMFRTRAPSWEFAKHLLVWHKTDNAGMIGDASRDFRHVHEIALFARRGRRVLVKNMSDTYGAPTARELHPSAKPEPMLKHFLTALVDEHTSLLDPTCGSGTALLAADGLGAARVCGIEKEGTHVESLRSALTVARRLRQMSRAATAATAA